MGKWKRHRSKGHRWIRDQLVRRDGASCRLCGKALAMKDMTIDHIIPKSRGGSDELTNLQLACDGCNQSKKSMLPEEYEQWLATA